MARENYEIYTYQDGRWSVYATFEGASEREKAQEQAVEVEKSTRLPVRLVRETVDDNNTSEEVIAWQSAKAKSIPDADDMFGTKPKEQKKPAKKKADKPPPRPKAPPPPPPEPKRKDSAPEPEDAGAAPAPKPKKKKRRRKTKQPRGVLAKLAIVVSMSLLMAVVAVGLTILTIGALQKFEVISTENRVETVAGVFILAYGLSALYQLVRQFELYKSWNFNFSLRRRKRADGEEKVSASDMIKKMNQAAREASGQAPDVPLDDGAGIVAPIEVPVDEMRAALEQEEAEQPGDRQGDDEFTTEVQTAEEAPPPLPEPVAPEPAQAAPPPEPAKVEKPAEKPVEKPPEKPAAPAKPKEPERPPVEAEAMGIFLTFVNDAVRVANQAISQLNAFTRFGLNLYLSGGCATLGQSRKLARMPQLTILRDGLQAGGTSRERAENFCAELPTYGKNPRYASMIQAGGQAMTRQLGGQPNATGDLAGLLNEWGRPEKRAAVPTEITFLFTDLVGSTAMTSQLGNAAAQRVVRAHNTAVRSAIQAFGGREVKHTGDGIMATFPTPVAAVQATIRMQKELVGVATANPALNFSVRMGINVGEAVEEDNDYFGAAVQMTARICAAASERNIWVSKAVVDACKGQRIGFIPRGAFQMKGIQQARPLFEVAYTDAHRNELSNL